MIREQPVKPLRVFLQEGVRSRQGGKFSELDWPAGNRAMARALAIKGYDYQFVMGDGDQSHFHGASILPDVMRWLWKGNA